MCFAEELDIESGKRGSRVLSVGNRDKRAHWLRWNRVLEQVWGDGDLELCFGNVRFGILLVPQIQLLKRPRRLKFGEDVQTRKWTKDIY